MLTLRKKTKSIGVVKVKKRNYQGIGYDIRNNKVMIAMLAPALIYFFIFYYVPMVGIILAFKDFKSDMGIFNSPWVGFKNFEFLVKSGVLLKITRNTVLYNIVFMVVNTVLAISVAIFISDVGKKMFRKITQSMMFLPYFISYVIVGSFAYNLLSQHGVINTTLKQLGYSTYNFYNSPLAWPYILVFFDAWKWVGYSSIIYLAAIMGINKSIYDSAEIDGAGKFAKVFRITLPLLVPTLVILSLLEIGKILRGQFQLFYQLVGNNGLLFDTTDIIETYVFRVLVGSSASIGMGAAVGLYQSVFGFMTVVTANYIIRKKQEDLALF